MAFGSRGAGVTTPATIFRGRWLIPAEGPVIADGAVVAAGGRILRVGPWSVVEPHVGPADRVEHLPDSAILPGFVNAHTHLPLSDHAGKFRPTRHFASWLARLVARRIIRTESGIRKAIALGARLSAEAGTVAAADLTSDPAWDDSLGHDGTRWIVFGEIFRHGPAAHAHLAKVVETLESLARAAPVRVGLSPHAPYTVGLDVFMAARREADARGWPISTHLHETPDEIAFTERGEGTLHTWLSRLGLLPPDWRPAGLRPIPMLAREGFFARPVLAAHANYLEDEEIAILARSGSSVAFCPRSHTFFKHTGHPWRRLLAAGVNVCLGTDSLASCPTLSMLDEARFLLAQEGGTDPRLLLDMVTRRGARALGLEDEVGDLRPGLAAVICAVAPVDRTDDPLGAVLGGACGPVRVLRA